jgi:hypothetical protein
MLTARPEGAARRGAEKRSVPSRKVLKTPYVGVVSKSDAFIRLY